jgi:crotonobetainyl-CoA:carnitine CoA-transferase CaiB-like acyl-CoA transferase
MGNTHPNLVPYQVFVAADGPLIIAVGNEAQFRRLCACLDAPAIADDADFATNPARVVHRDRLVPMLAALIGARSRGPLLEALDAAGIPAGPINALDAVFADPQVIHRGLAVQLAAPAAAGGTVPAVRNPILLDGEPLVSPLPAPRLDEAGAEIRAEYED